MVPKWLWFLVEVAVKASGDLATLMVTVQQGYQVAVATATLLKCGHRKS